MYNIGHRWRNDSEDSTCTGIFSSLQVLFFFSNRNKNNSTHYFTFYSSIFFQALT